MNCVLGKCAGGGGSPTALVSGSCGSRRSAPEHEIRNGPAWRDLGDEKLWALTIHSFRFNLSVYVYWVRGVARRLASKGRSSMNHPATPLVVGIGGTVGGPSSTERALVIALRVARAAGLRTQTFGGAELEQCPLY